MLLRLILAIVSTIAISTCWGQYGSFEKVCMEMETKSVKGGYKSAVNAKIYYSNDGRMVSYFSFPKEYVILNNSKGEIKIYDSEKNTVLQQQNFMYSTESSQFYFFLNNKKADLGLGQMGFVQSNVKFEEGLMISEWLPPMSMASQLSKVELVHENENPIYIAYFDQNNELGTKSYYYNYVSLDKSVSFPSTITQISYSTPTDSTITKTTYSNIRLDNQVNQEAMNFKIPDNAKAIN
jgi:outer membrane lipoprotein-sorting protein